jgi:hypothetical protein
MSLQGLSPLRLTVCDLCLNTTPPSATAIMPPTSSPVPSRPGRTTGPVGPAHSHIRPGRDRTLREAVRLSIHRLTQSRVIEGTPVGTEPRR